VFAALAPSWRDRESLRSLSRYERHSATPDAAAHLLRLSDRIDVRPILGSISVPTLVLHRRDDDIVPVAAATEVVAGIPGAELVILEGSDHLVYVDHGAVLDAVEAFTTGTVSAPPPTRVLTTVLFVDVVGSTALAERLGDQAWSETLADFYRTARDHLARFRGDEVVTTGDGLLATFDAPVRAVQFGLAFSATARWMGLSLRVGVHTSEVERVGADISGLGVNVGARVASAARPGEVWVTRTVRDLVAGAGLRFDPRGTHGLKGVSDPWELFAAA
jgi:class 3 adenylate cyclase